MTYRYSRARCVIATAAMLFATLFASPWAMAALITNLTVNNSTGQGGTGDTYVINSNAFASGALEYVDRSYTWTTPIPSSVNGQTYIETANGDKAVDEGVSNFMSFTVTQAATVYVAYDPGISPKPTWLTTGFTDTGTQVESYESGTTKPFELYSHAYAANATVTLGGNYPSGYGSNNGMYSVIVVPTAGLTLSNLVVNNSTGQGGTGLTYTINSNAFASGVTQYVDRSYQIGTPVPSTLNGQTYIETANGDKGTGAGSSNFMSFSANENVIVYVAHDTQISSKPTWLTANFLDTGTQVYGSSGSTEPFEVYEAIYPGNTTITLGSNIPSGWNTSQSSMYTVIAAAENSSSTPPAAPSSLEQICSTAAVVGLKWTASTDPVGIFAYRISRNGAVIGTVSYAQTQYSDQTVSGSTGYQYVVTAIDEAGNSTESSVLNVETAAPSTNGDAPYCPSTTITNIAFNYSGAFTENYNPTHESNPPDQPPTNDGADLWPVTWGQDGNTYLSFGDGWGLCGEDDNNCSVDDTSLGFAVISGSPPFTAPPSCPAQFANIYGGYNSSHPYNGNQNGLVNGKLAGVIAVGSNFYAIGQAWRSADGTGSPYPYNSPNHIEILSSIGNGYSWADTTWNFCSADTSGNPNPTGGLNGALGVCPTGILNFGEGNSGARDSYVYIYAEPSDVEYWQGKAVVPRLTYLLRVPNNEVTTASAYQYYAGLDLNGNPIWSVRQSQAQPVFVDGNAAQNSSTGHQFPMGMNLEAVVYDAPIGRYIAPAQAQKVGQVAFYDAPNPWGPWSAIAYYNITAASGTGGWGNLGAGGTGGSQADSLGVNIGNAWTSADGKTIWMTFSSDGYAPANASFAGLPGNNFDSLNIVEATLTLAGGGGGGTLGSQATTPPAVADNGDNNTMSGSSITVGSQNIQVSSITVWINNSQGGTNNQFEVAIYADNGHGQPGTLVASSSTQTINPGSWNTVSLSQTLNANTTYWLLYNTNSTNINDNTISEEPSTTQNSWYYTGQTFGSWPATAPAGHVESPQQAYSIYLTYQ